MLFRDFELLRFGERIARSPCDSRSIVRILTRGYIYLIDRRSTHSARDRRGSPSGCGSKRATQLHLIAFNYKQHPQTFEYCCTLSQELWSGNLTTNHSKIRLTPYLFTITSIQFSVSIQSNQIWTHMRKLKVNRPLQAGTQSEHVYICKLPLWKRMQ